MVEKTLNRIQVEDLLNPQHYPFLHIVENMSGVYKTISFSNVTFRAALSSPLATQYICKQCSPLPLEGTLLLVQSVLCSSQPFQMKFGHLLEWLWVIITVNANFFMRNQLFSIIDRYWSGVWTTHHLTKANYRHIFQVILEGIWSLQGQALSDFQEMGKTLFMHAYMTIPMPGPSTMQSCPIAWITIVFSAITIFVLAMNLQTQFLG